MNQLEELKDKLRPFLKTLLNDAAVSLTPSGMFACINPEHEDASPSCRILPDSNDQQFFCYGCHFTGDIFTACSILEGTPLVGIDFVHDNLYLLAERYDIPYERIEWTEEQIEDNARLSVTRVASELMVVYDKKDTASNWTCIPMQARDWNIETCRKLAISSIVDYDKFVAAIQLSTRLTISQIMGYGITADLFGPDYITITLHDMNGKPVGFTSRWLSWTNESTGPKYKNSHTSGTFHKNTILYGIHLTKHNKHRRLDLFEGNGSFITAYQAGHRTCASLCTNAITREQIKIIRDIGFSHVNLIFDPDKAGVQAANKYMEVLGGLEGLRISLTELPDHTTHGVVISDPEDFIRECGLGALFKLKTTSAFDFFLQRELGDTSSTTDPVEFVAKMIPIIVNCDNRIERGQQMRELANAVDVPEADIRAEISRTTALDVDMLRSNFVRDLGSITTPDQMVDIASSYIAKVEASTGLADERAMLSVSESMEAFEDLVTILNNKTPGIQGWRTGFTLLDQRLSGIPKPVGKDDDGNEIPIPGSLMGIAGASQHGKSTILQNLSLGMVRNNDDIMCLYWSLDDSRERTLERMLAQMSGVSWRAVTRRIPPTIEDLRLLRQAEDEMRALMSDGKLIIKDQKAGSTLTMLKRWIRMAQDSIGKPCVIICDSFHKLADDSNYKHSRADTAARLHSGLMKNIAHTHNVSIIASLEMNKTQAVGSEPSMLQITETRKLEYDLDIVALVFNEYFDTDGKGDNKIIRPDGRVDPLIKFNVKKSKEGGAGVMWFALNPENFRIQCYSNEEVKNILNLAPVTETEVGGGVNIIPRDKGGLQPIEPWDKPAPGR